MCGGGSVCKYGACGDGMSAFKERKISTKSLRVFGFFVRFASREPCGKSGFVVGNLFTGQSA